MNCEITIPVLNEEDTLVENVLKVLSFFAENKITNFSICIADNGSTDKTASLAKKLAGEYEVIRYVSVEKKGVGLALKKSWTTSSAEIVGYMDLDLATDLNHLLEVRESFLHDEELKVIYGSRLAKGASVFGRKIQREVTSRALNILVRNVFNNDISDVMCGFKFYKKTAAFEMMKSGAESDGWFFCAETLIVGHQLGHKMKELPVRWSDDSNSKVKVIKLTLEYLKAINKLRKKK